MIDPEETEGQAGPEAEPALGMSDKVLRLHEALSQADIPYAFGGALAADFYRVPRGTIDIDLAIFLPPAERHRVLEALEGQFSLPERESLSREIAAREQGKTYWGHTRLDLFFSVSDFHKSVAERVETVEYQETKIPILSAEDIVVFKAVFDRSQDWADIEAIAKVKAGELDTAYMTGWLAKIIGAGDSRIERLQKAIGSG